MVGIVWKPPKGSLPPGCNDPDTVYPREIVFRKDGCIDRSIGGRLAGIIYLLDGVGVITQFVVTGVSLPVDQGARGEIDISPDRIGLGRMPVIRELAAKPTNHNFSPAKS